ncbi:MAD2L1-binding protein [Patella vulgata]|uniref:MAD2L1-binding protein n=1 Tax=Patella vulgata TaxID=6465 RepID=UPI0024A9DB42|nr:MAD2L1-binding protein [Patella vulgata]
MAGNLNKRLNFRVKENVNKSCDLIFDGGLHSTTRGAMVNELVKYFMYERQQIPVPFDHAKRELKKLSELQEIESRENEKRNEMRQKQMPLSSKRKLKNRLTERKASSALENLDLIFENIQKSFEHCPEISQIMIVLGSTVVSPKEMYIIQMPPLSPDAENIVFKSCVRSLFRQLITQDLLGNIKGISPTNMTVLLKAPRGCNIEWFTPKHNFKTSSRGQQFMFNCVCEQPVVLTHDLTHDANEFDISGIDCLDSLDIDMSATALDDVSLSELLSRRISFGHHKYQTPVASKTPIDRINHKATTPAQTINQDDDHLWFQSPVVVKGYRDPAHQK